MRSRGGEAQIVMAQISSATREAIQVCDRPTRVFWQRLAFETAIGGIGGTCFITPIVREFLQDIKQEKEQRKQGLKEIPPKYIGAYILVLGKKDDLPTKDEIINVLKKLELPYETEQLDKTIQAFHGSIEES
jgi:hypothetical protein